MAPKRHLQDPPPPAPASSSTEDEVEDSENDAVEEEANGVSDVVEYDDEKSEDDEEDEEEEEEDDHRNMTNRSTPIASSKASERHSSSDSGDGSTEESDSETDKTQPSPSVSDFTIKPVVSKPINDSAKPQKNAAKRNSAPAPPTTIATGGSKRVNESNTEGKEAKKKKVSNGQDEDVKKGSGFQRLWSEDDEMAILKGMIDYQSKRGADPCADMAAFHEYIKNNLHAEVSKNQLVNKVRTLKKKFQTNAKKGENGEDPVFSKPRDQKFFELSKKVWGYGATTNGVDKRKPSQSKSKNALALALPKLEMDLKKEEANGEMNAGPAKSRSNSSFLDGLLVSGKLMLPESSMSIMKEAMPLIGSSKAKELEGKWKKLQDDEFLLYLKRVELIHETAKLLLDAKKSST